MFSRNVSLYLNPFGAMQWNVWKITDRWLITFGLLMTCDPPCHLLYVSCSGRPTVLLVAHCALLWRFVMRQQITFSVALSFVPLVPLVHSELTRFARASLNFNSCTLFTTSLPVIQFHDYLSVTLWFSFYNHLEIKVTSFILYFTSLTLFFTGLARVFTLRASFLHWLQFVFVPQGFKKKVEKVT